MDAQTHVNSDTEARTPLFHVKILRQYINALAINVKPPEGSSPKQLNLIFDSGAVNGVLGIGAALYIQHLEKLNHVKINKISGCSIGSLIAVWYICGCPETIYYSMDTLFDYYKKNKNFFIFEQIVETVINQLFEQDDDMKKLNGILYINYYDTKKCKQCVVSKFKDRAHLITCILRSSHVPFLTSNRHKYQGRYVDGIAPYIFKNETKCKNLFIQLIQFTSPLKSLNIKREKNIYSRLINGVVAANDFFINGASTLCCYVNYKTKLNLWARQYVVLFFLYLIDCFLFLKNNMPLTCQCKLSSTCRFIWRIVLNNIV